jgi:hypothetical protein
MHRRIPEGEEVEAAEVVQAGVVAVMAAAVGSDRASSAS